MEREQVDNSPSGPVAAFRDWIAANLEADMIAPLTGGLPPIETWYTLTDRRLLDNGDEIVLLIPPTIPAFATEQTDYKLSVVAIAAQMRRTEDGWQVVQLVNAADVP